jgi:hypothetical protein
MRTRPLLLALASVAALAAAADPPVLDTTTARPKYFYTSAVHRNEDGRFTIEVEVEQVPGRRTVYRLVSAGQGRWSLTSAFEPAPTHASSLIVPYEVALASGKRTSGTVELAGTASRFTIPVDSEPGRFSFDPRGEVMAGFFDDSHTKRALRTKARLLPPERAEEVLLSTLDAPLYSAAELAHGDRKHADLDRLERQENAAALLELALLQLQQGRLDDGAISFERARPLLEQFDEDSWLGLRTRIRAYVTFLFGSYDVTYSILSDHLWLDLDPTSDAGLRKKFLKGHLLTGDAYAMLAASAWETGHADVARAAIIEAEGRGVDASELRTRMDATRSR